MSNDNVVAAYSFILFVLLAIALPIAFLPSIIAFRRQHPNRWVILVVNGFLGPIGGIGWLLALVWSMRAVHKSPLTITGQGTDGGESGLNIFSNDERKVRIVGGTVTPAEELTKLKELLDNGAISHEEFSSLKSAVLAKQRPL